MGEEARRARVGIPLTPEDRQEIERALEKLAVETRGRHISELVALVETAILATGEEESEGDLGLHARCGDAVSERIEALLRTMIAASREIACEIEPDDPLELARWQSEKPYRRDLNAIFGAILRLQPAADAGMLDKSEEAVRFACKLLSRIELEASAEVRTSAGDGHARRLVRAVMYYRHNEGLENTVTWEPLARVKGKPGAPRTNDELIPRSRAALLVEKVAGAFKLDTPNKTSKTLMMNYRSSYLARVSRSPELEDVTLRWSWPLLK